MQEHRTPIHVVLVHGTFGRSSKWYRHGSRLRKCIESAFPQGVKFHVFKWTGLNWHVARIKAAGDFLDFLSIQLSDVDPKKIYVISHSHGGNVVWYAHNVSENFLNNIGGAVFLGTPFLEYRYVQRNRAQLRSSVKLWVLYFNMLIGFTYLSAIFFMSYFVENGILLLFLIVMFGLYLTNGANFLTKRKHIDWLRQQRRVKHLCKLIEPRLITNDNILVVSNRMDEAAVHLRSAYFLSQIFHLFKSANNLPFLAALALTFAVLLLYSYFSPNHIIAYNPLFFSVSIVLITGPLLIVWSIMSLISSSIFNFLFVSRYTFGPDLGLDLRFCKVKLTKQLPLTRYCITFKTSAKMNSHVSYYNDFVVCDKIVEVLRKTRDHTS